MTAEHKKLIEQLLDERPPTRAFLIEAMRNMYRWQGKAKPDDVICLLAHSTRMARSMSQTFGSSEYMVEVTLLHDCEEVYTSDIPPYLKTVIPAIPEFATKLRREIFKRLDILWPSKEVWDYVKILDLADAEYEKSQISKLDLWIK